MITPINENIEDYCNAEVCDFCESRLHCFYKKVRCKRYYDEIKRKSLSYEMGREFWNRLNKKENNGERNG